MNTASFPPDQLAGFLMRLSSTETQLKQLQDQLQNYLPIRESELQLTNIRDTVTRIERDIVAMRVELAETSKKLVTQEQEARQRDTDQREAQDKLQIRTLYTTVTIIITILSGILIGYVTHFFH